MYKQIIIGAILVIILGVFFFVVQSNNSEKGEQKIPEDEMVACTMDVMMCPDGSYLGRVAPNCEFQACPL
jgi:hypothetical protein